MFWHAFEVQEAPAPLAELCSLLPQPDACRPTSFPFV